VSDPEQIRAVYDRYPELFCKGDLDGLVALYAENATIEDPIGSEIHVGHDAIRAFYAPSAGSVTLKRTGPVCVAGNEAATLLAISMGDGADRKVLDIVSTMKFAEDGRIESMRAYWSFDALRPATEAD
jgi:steroid delta-isomerase